METREDKIERLKAGQAILAESVERERRRCDTAERALESAQERCATLAAERDALLSFVKRLYANARPTPHKQGEGTQFFHDVPNSMIAEARALLARMGAT